MKQKPDYTIGLTTYNKILLLSHLGSEIRWKKVSDQFKDLHKTIKDQIAEQDEAYRQAQIKAGKEKRKQKS